MSSNSKSNWKLSRNCFRRNSPSLSRLGVTGRDIPRGGASGGITAVTSAHCESAVRFPEVPFSILCSSNPPPPRADGNSARPTPSNMAAAISFVTGRVRPSCTAVLGPLLPPYEACAVLQVARSRVRFPVTLLDDFSN
jgi:hypothetical protein